MRAFRAVAFDEEDGHASQDRDVGEVEDAGAELAEHDVQEIDHAAEVTLLQPAVAASRRQRSSPLLMVFIANCEKGRF